MSPAGAPLLCHGSWLPVLDFHGHGPPTGQPLHPDEICLCPCPQHQAQTPGCKFALGQKCSHSPRRIITLSGRDVLEGKKVFLWFGNTLHLVQVWCGDGCVPIYTHCGNFIWREPARTGFHLTAKDLFGFLCWKLCFSRGVGWGEPDGPMNIVVMDKSRGGTVKPAECKQPPTPCWQRSLKRSVRVASLVLRQSARGFTRPPLALMCRIPSISAARFAPHPPPDLRKWKAAFLMGNPFPSGRAISCRWSLSVST